MNIRFSVVVLIAIFLGILFFSTTCGCTHGGAYGLYEGITDIASSGIGSGKQINLNITKGSGTVSITSSGSGSGSGSGPIAPIGSDSEEDGSDSKIRTITSSSVMNRESFDSSGTGKPKASGTSKTVPVPTTSKPKGSGTSTVASSTPALVSKKEAFTSLTGEPSTSLWGVPATLPNYVPPANNNPLSYGELNMFANTQFKPECCPSTYTTSTGCACISNDQYSYMLSRGGNNVPFAN